MVDNVHHGIWLIMSVGIAQNCQQRGFELWGFVNSKKGTPTRPRLKLTAANLDWFDPFLKEHQARCKVPETMVTCSSCPFNNHEISITAVSSFG